MLFCRSCFLAMVWFRCVLIFLMFLFLLLSNKYYSSKLTLLDFRCQKISFLCKLNFCIDEKHTQWHWDTRVKVFHESLSRFMKCPWNCVSWNALKEKFTVYPYLNDKFSRIGMSFHHLIKKTFIEASCTNNIHTGEKGFCRCHF